MKKEAYKTNKHIIDEAGVFPSDNFWVEWEKISANKIKTEEELDIDLLHYNFLRKYNLL